MNKLSLKLALLSAVLLSCQVVNAQPGASTDASQDTGSMSGGSGGHHGHWNRQGRHVPTREQVMSLSSLTPAQKQDINAIYKQAHQTMRPLIAQLRQQGGAEPSSTSGSNLGNAPGGTAINPQKADLIRQIREQKMSTWQAVKAKLTPDQISQLQQQSAQPQALNQ